MTEKGPILSYTNLRHEPAGERFEPAWKLLSFSVCVGGLGLLVAISTVVCRSLGWDGGATAWASLLFVWLICGMIITCAIALVALVDLIRACFYSIDTLAGIGKALVVLIGVLMNLPLAFLTVSIGVGM